jgi:hypothetical protein
MATFILGGLWHGAGWTFIFWGFLHGMALVIHRGWKALGFTMNKYLAWFITFNFVNIAWVFFRAKEWDDAIKVLKGMFGLSGIMLPEKYAGKLTFLNDLGIEFGHVFENINGKSKTITFLILAFILILKFKNSMFFRDNFVASYKYMLFVVIILSYCIFSFNQASEFLYFNF